MITLNRVRVYYTGRSMIGAKQLSAISKENNDKPKTLVNDPKKLQVVQYMTKDNMRRPKQY